MKSKSNIPVLGLAAYSGTGKTTLLVKLVPLLKKCGIAVGVIKHAHHTFEIDHPSKDSYKIRKAGAKQILIGSKKRWALVTEQEATDPANRLQEHISHLDQDKLDLILVEGFKPEAIPKIELHRPKLKHPLICKTDKNIIAIATDGEISEDIEAVILDLNNHRSIANYIIDTFNLREAISVDK